MKTWNHTISILRGDEQKIVAKGYPYPREYGVWAVPLKALMWRCCGFKMKSVTCLCLSCTDVSNMSSSINIPSLISSHMIIRLPHFLTTPRHLVFNPSPDLADNTYAFYLHLRENRIGSGIGSSGCPAK